MTIGIATRGPRAGLAAWRALLAAELLGRGEIGGFCVFTWRDAAGEFRQLVTQQGGTSGLPELPPGWQEAEFAAIISSGPNRPEPLSQFLPFDTAHGLVTGHRLPTSRTTAGEALNLAALALMRQGRLSPESLAELLAGPAMDAGLICLPLKGPVVLANSPRVETRDDHGRHLREEGPKVAAVLHNSIHAATLMGHGLAAALTGIAGEALGMGSAAHGIARLPDRVRVIHDGQEAVHLDAAGLVTAIHSADPAYGGIRPGITAIYSRMPVWQGGRRIGHAASEVFARLDTRELHARPGHVARSFVFTRL